MSMFSDFAEEIITCVEEGHGVEETIEFVSEVLTRRGLMEDILKEIGVIDD